MSPVWIYGIGNLFGGMPWLLILAIFVGFGWLLGTVLPPEEGQPADEADL